MKAAVERALSRARRWRGPSARRRRFALPSPPMGRMIFFYAAALAGAAFALEWLEYRFLARAHAREIYVLLVAVGFAALGGWVGWRLTPRAAPPAFARNDAALASLGVSPREYETLALLAEGLPNKEIARRLGVSPNTVKTHLARVFEKLGAANRVEAVARARALSLIA